MPLYGNLTSTSDVDSQERRKELNESLTELGVSPLKLHGIRTESQFTYGKRKMEKVQATQRDKSKGVASKMTRALNVFPEQLQNFDKVNKYDRLTSLIKSQITDS